jgi:hypothetical protein
MNDEVNISEVAQEIKNADEDKLRQTIEDHFSSVRTQGMKIGATYISAAVYDAINKNIKTGSLRDYQRAIKAVQDIISVQLKQEITQ